MRQPQWGLLLLVLLWGAAAAASGSQDLLNELDSLMAPPKAADPASASPDRNPVLGQISDHLDTELRLSYAGFLKSKPHHDDTEGEARLMFNTWAGGDRFSFHLDGWVEYGTQADTYAGVSPVWEDKKRERRVLEISEFYWLGETDRAGLILGKRVLPDNTNCIYALSRVYHPMDLNVPVEPRQLGVWQAGADIPLGEDTVLSAALFPVFQDHKVPAAGSRWMTSQADALPWYAGAGTDADDAESLLTYWFGDAVENDPELLDRLDTESVVVENDVPDTDPDEMGVRFLVKTVVGKADLFASVFRGPNPFPLVRVDDRGSVVALVRQNPLVVRTSVGGTYTWGNVEVHAETLFSHSKDGTDDDYLAYTGGVTVTDEWTAALLNVNQVHWRIDYAGEIVTDEQDADGYYLSTNHIRPFTDDLLLHILCQVNDRTNLYYHLDLDFGDNANSHRIGGTHRLYPGLVMELFAEFFDGDRTSFIGLWEDNDRISCRLTWSF